MLSICVCKSMSAEPPRLMNPVIQAILHFRASASRWRAVPLTSERLPDVGSGWLGGGGAYRHTTQLGPLRTLSYHLKSPAKMRGGHGKYLRQAWNY
jgi:hypothetical protein